MRKVIIERHCYKTKQVLNSPRGPIDVEIETLTIVTTMVGDDEDEAVEYGPFEEELLRLRGRAAAGRPNFSGWSDHR